MVQQGEGQSGDVGTKVVAVRIRPRARSLIVDYYQIRIIILMLRRTTTVYIETRVMYMHCCILRVSLLVVSSLCGVCCVFRMAPHGIGIVFDAGCSHSLPDSKNIGDRYSSLVTY